MKSILICMTYEYLNSLITEEETENRIRIIWSNGVWQMALAMSTWIGDF